MLKANFDVDSNPADGNTTAEMDGVSITGTIDDFMTGDMARTGWMVKLKAQDNTPDVVESPITLGVQNYTELNERVMGTTEWSMGGAAMPADGIWMADVYGGGANDYPDAMTGMFYADGITGSIAGAFGVEEK